MVLCLAGMDPEDLHKDPGSGIKRSSEDVPQSPVKARKTEELTKDPTTPTPKKQITLAASLKKIGSPCEIKKVTSPGAKRAPSLLEVLSGEVKQQEAMPKDIVVGVEGEEVQDTSKIQNGSRDRQSRTSFSTASHRWGRDSKSGIAL